MKFDKTRVFTISNASNLKLGSKGYFADYLPILESRISYNLQDYFGELTSMSLDDIHSFEKDSNEHFVIFYLVEEPKIEKGRHFDNIDTNVITW